MSASSASPDSGSGEKQVNHSHNRNPTGKNGYPLCRESSSTASWRVVEHLISSAPSSDEDVSELIWAYKFGDCMGRKAISKRLLEKDGIKMRYTLPVLFSECQEILMWLSENTVQRRLKKMDCTARTKNSRMLSEKERRNLVWKYCDPRDYKQYMERGMRKSRAIIKCIREETNYIIPEYAFFYLFSLVSRDDRWYRWYGFPGNSSSMYWERFPIWTFILIRSGEFRSSMMIIWSV